MDPRFAILVVSYDGYSHLWQPGFACLFKALPAPAMPIYLGTNKKTFADPRVQSLRSGADLDWSSSLLKILKQIKETHILVLLDDFFIETLISNERLQRVFQFMQRESVRHIKLWPDLPPDQECADAEFSEYLAGAPGRVSVCGFWQVEALKGLLLVGENPWNFEIMGSYRSSYCNGGFYCLNEPLFIFHNMIEKGSWVPKELNWARSVGLQLDLGGMPILKGKMLWKSKLQIVVFHAILRIPWRWRVRAMNFLRRLFISY